MRWLVPLLLWPGLAGALECPGERDPLGALLVDLGRVERVSREDALRLAERGPTAGLRPATRARLVEALMRGSTGDREERAILTLLRDASPVDRADTLREIDQGTDGYDVVKLFFDDVDDPSRRSELLALAAEANGALAAAGRLELGVISDVDDTAVPDAFRPDGRDSFDGAAALYERLERGPDGSGAPGHVHYVTGRPPVAALDLRDRLRRGGIPEGTLSHGDLGEVILGGLDGIAREKVRDIERVLAAHPGQRFVLLGDDRQRDPEVYREIARRHPERIAAVLVHRAGGRSRDPAAFPGTTFFEDFREALDSLP